MAKVSELSGAALDWAVAKCEGGFNLRLVSTYGTKTAWQFTMKDDEDPKREDSFYLADYEPSTDWGLGGPIIERELLQLYPVWVYSGWHWVAFLDEDYEKTGPTPLIAAMRFYVASKFGEEIEIPKELL